MKKQRGQYHKYTESERVEIKRLYNEGSMSYRGIAKMLGYPESSVKSIILSGIDEPGHGIRYPKAHRAGIMQMEVVEPMPRKVSGEDLKRENRDLREEVEYLKDKVAYLESLYEISMKEKAGSAQKKEVQRYPCSNHRERTEECEEAVRYCRCLSEMLLCS